MATSSAFPPPPPFYGYYKDFLDDPDSAPLPPPPIDGTYTMFGATYTVSTSFVNSVWFFLFHFLHRSSFFSLFGIIFCFIHLFPILITFLFSFPVSVSPILFDLFRLCFPCFLFDLLVLVLYSYHFLLSFFHFISSYNFHVHSLLHFPSLCCDLMNQSLIRKFFDLLDK